MSMFCEENDEGPGRLDFDFFLVLEIRSKNASAMDVYPGR